MEGFLEMAELTNGGRDHAVVIGGDQITKIMKFAKNSKPRDLFVKLTSSATSILCCRVSPK